MSKFSGVLGAVKKQDNGPTTTAAVLRQPGKRSDPDFVQANAYIPKALHREVKLKLLQEGDDRQYSALVEELLQEWVSK